LAEHVGDWFEPAVSNPYMLMVSSVREDRRVAVDTAWNDDIIQQVQKVRSEIPAVTHVDFSARVQTVDDAVSPDFAELLRAFLRLTGCPILVNTSFNVRGEPIVCTPGQALRCFLSTDLDALEIGAFLLLKSENAERAQPESERAAYADD
jgi:carbamoyltransferase